MTNVSLIDQDSAARARALDAETSFIVQAPAGSGKTELLTQRFLRLLATVEHPEQVLAITFTRKAAAEMRARILKSLELGVSETPPAAAHAQTTWSLARAVRAVDRARQWNLMQHPARLRIQTIDSLTSMLARRLPILAGTGAALEPVDNARTLYEAAAHQLLERLGDGTTVARQLELLILHLGNRVDTLVALLIDLLARRDQWLHPVVQARGSERLRDLVERALRTVVSQHLRQLCASLTSERRQEIWELTRHAASNRLNNGSLDAFTQALFEPCRDLNSTLDASSDSLHAWRAVAKVFLTAKGDIYKTADARHGFPASEPAPRERMLRMLRELADDHVFCRQLQDVRNLPSTEYTDAQWRVLESLLGVLPVAVTELQLTFQRRGQADYVESALRALRALGNADEPTDLALAFDYRLRHILIDEFQDTSFTQLDLLERLTAGWTPGDGRTLFCVGDPMQSIYRFRQAEVGLFIELQERGLDNLPLEKLTLRRNFRSTPNVVRWVNHTFPRVFPLQDAAEQGAVRYSESIASVTNDGGGVHVHATIDASREDTADAVVSVVRRSLDIDDTGSVAILVSGRNHLGFIAEKLHEAGIEHRAIEIEPLRDRPVVQDLVALTRALVHLGDRTAWLAILRAPWCGLTLEDLHRLAADDARATIRELIQRAVDKSTPAAERIRLSAEGQAALARLAAVLDAALLHRSRYRLRDWVEKTWLLVGGPATLATAQDLDDARAYFRRLDDIDEAGDLDDVARLEEHLEGLCARPRTQTHARVEIMTIHKAKGLEFDTVVLPGLERWVRGSDQPLLRWTRVAGVDNGLILAPLTRAGEESDVTYRWLELLEQERQDLERARLLYVAATRAKRDLHLFGNAESRVKDGVLELRGPRKGSMLGMLWPVVRADYEAALGNVERRTRDGSPFRQSVPLKRIPLDWQAPAVGSSIKVQLSNRIEVINPERPEFDWASETSRIVGTLVHRELDRLTRNPQVRPEPSRPRVTAELRELGIPEDRIESATERVLIAVRNTLNDARGRWLLGLDQDIRDAESELPLSGVIAGQIVNRVIDRSFIDAHGIRWIVDFKTSTHEGGGLDAFLDAEVERYRPQLTRYAQLMQLYRPGEVVRAALYFPLLKEWREVPLVELEARVVRSRKEPAKQLDLGF